MQAEECVYYIKVESSTVWIIVYLDDVLVIGMVVQAVETVKGWLKSKFEMTDHGQVKSFLGVAFLYTLDGVCLRQKHFINTVLQRFGMHNCKPVGTPLVPGRQTEDSSCNHKAVDQKLYQQAIGSLLYIETRTRPDIGAVVNIAARKASAPTLGDSGKVKCIMRYLQGTSELGLNSNWEHGNGLPEMIAYSDADWAGDLSDRKSTNGLILLINGTPVVWKSRKQVGVALSSCESE